VIICEPLVSWNGLLGDGSSVVSPDRLSGSRWRVGSLVQEKIVPSSPGNMVMVDLTCNGQVSLFPNEPLTNEGFIYALRMIELSYGLQDLGWVYLLSIHPQVAQLPLLNKVFGIAYGYLKTIEQKRALQRGETLSDESFKYTWSWEQFLYDWIYAPNGKPFVDHGPSMSSLYSFWLQQFSGEGFYQVPLPPTCSFARWINDGVCSFDYSGFAELFGADITFRTTIKRCSDPGLPAIQLQCVGSLVPPSLDLFHVLQIQVVQEAWSVVH